MIETKKLPTDNFELLKYLENERIIKITKVNSFPEWLSPYNKIFLLQMRNQLISRNSIDETKKILQRRLEKSNNTFSQISAIADKMGTKKHLTKSFSFQLSQREKNSRKMRQTFKKLRSWEQNGSQNANGCLFLQLQITMPSCK